jgi:hypothetical protein
VPPDLFKILLCGGVAVFAAGIIVRDLLTGVSGLSGMGRISCAADVNPAGYWLLILFKTGIVIYLTMILLHLLGVAADPNLAIKGMLSGARRES